ncbi:hypothetical protein K6U27_04580 [Vibrio fluvialis]|nr:hypothetical protein [Vibrio fluvialis]MCG6371972.1 hypothetical protein [Vibrio fluvialis]
MKHYELDEHSPVTDPTFIRKVLADGDLQSIQRLIALMSTTHNNLFSKGE